MNQDQIIKEISRTIHNTDPDAESFLFGSRARGDNRLDSDWDVLILINAGKVTNDIEDKFRDGLYQIELESEQIISAFIYSKQYWHDQLKYSPLYDNVTREGVAL